MSAAQRFLDSLRDIGLVLSTALEHVQKDRDEFMTMANEEQISQFESSITRVRFFSEQLDKELSYLEYLIAEPTQRSK